MEDSSQWPSEEFCGRKFYNLTPHIIRVVLPDGEKVIHPSFQALRLHEKTKCLVNFCGLEVVTHEYRNFNYQFKWPHERAIMIVSLPVLQFVQNHKSTVENPYRYVAPDTSPESCIRDTVGDIYGVRRFLGVK